jgi:hypothetical protein
LILQDILIIRLRLYYLTKSGMQTAFGGTVGLLDCAPDHWAAFDVTIPTLCVR